MAIIGTITPTIANGQTADATVVMAMLAYIQSQVNANACPATSGTGILKGNGTGGTSQATLADQPSMAVVVVSTNTSPTLANNTAYENTYSGGTANWTLSGAASGWTVRIFNNVSQNLILTTSQGVFSGAYSTGSTTLLLTTTAQNIEMWFDGTNWIVELSTKAIASAISSAIATATSTSAPINSPSFTGSPSAPTPLVSDNSTNLATTANVKANLATLPNFSTVAAMVTSLGTTYQNNTGKAFFMSLSAYCSSGSSITGAIVIGPTSGMGITASNFLVPTSGGVAAFTMTAMIPAGYYWQATTTGTVSNWESYS